MDRDWDPGRGGAPEGRLRVVVEEIDTRLALLRDQLAGAVASLAEARTRRQPPAPPAELAELRAAAYALMDATEALCRRAAAYLTAWIEGGAPISGGLSLEHALQLRFLYLDGAAHIARVRAALPVAGEADHLAQHAERLTTELLGRLRS